MTRWVQCFKPDYLRTTEGQRKGETSGERPGSRGLSPGSLEAIVDCGGTIEKIPTQIY